MAPLLSNFFDPRCFDHKCFDHLSKYALFLAIASASFSLPADATAGSCEEPCEMMPIVQTCYRGHIFGIGPEVYAIRRNRAGGTKQRGALMGVRANYDHIKRYHIYVGAQLFYGNGILDGKTGEDDRLRSRWTDLEAEGVVGYCFQMKCAPRFAATPFLGYGYFKEKNSFSPPSPLLVELSTRFQYATFGALTSVSLLPWLTVGFNARFRWPWQVRCHVLDDEFGNATLNVGERLQYRLELPIVYGFYCSCEESLATRWGIKCMPFYERRPYGAYANFPFDYLKTTIEAYGLNFQLIYSF